MASSEKQVSAVRHPGECQRQGGISSPGFEQTFAYEVGSVCDEDRFAFQVQL